MAFEQWGRIFGNDDVIAAAILDRLLHYSEVFAINGPSYRLRGKLGNDPQGVGAGQALRENPGQSQDEIYNGHSIA